METRQSTDLVEHMLKELQQPKSALTEWESDFLISISNHFDRKRQLSDKQFNILERIYAEKTE